MIYRDILNDLRNWAVNPDRKPLILRGARQVGKTTAVNLVAKEFDQYVYLMLEQVEDRNLFQPEKAFDDILAAIFFNKNIQRNPNKKTLIFIDEIQNSATAIAMLRYFYEHAKELFVISAGSLLETLLDKDLSFPVGRVEYMFMHPLSFGEYLKALGENEAYNLLDTIPIPSFAHGKLLNLFHQYTLLGGMPEAVKKYVINHDIIEVNSVYQNLLTAYADDVEKYEKNTAAKNYIRHVIEHAPFEAGKRIKFHGFGISNYGSTEIGEALRALEKAMLLYLIYPTTATTPPIIPDKKKSPKLQFLDTGFVNYIAGLQKYFFKLNDLNAFYQGLIAEHIVGQELIAANITSMRKLNFWVREKKQSNAEVDFVLPFNNCIIPIEVKAGKAGTLRSLYQFMDATNHSLGIRLSANNFSSEEVETTSGKKFTLLNIPYYLASKIPSYLEKYF